VHGGGLYANANAEGTHISTGGICAQDFRIDDNRAPDGAALYGADDTDFLDTEDDAAIFLNAHDQFGLSCRADVLAAAGIGDPVCVAGQAAPCNEISGNKALTAAGDPSGGAIVKGTQLTLNRTNLHDNDGGQIVYGFDGSLSTQSLTNTLIADNHSQHEIVRADDDSSIQNVTIVNNTIDNGSVFFLKHGVDFQDNLIWQPGHSTIDYQTDGCDNCFHAKNALVSEAASFPEGVAIVLKTSLDAFGFIDASNANVAKRDYHLDAWMLNRVNFFSPAVDVAVPVDGDDRDLDNNPHDQDIVGVDNGPGVRDLGGYELQRSQLISDRIFADAFGDRITLLH
jgi:hypothetical protein